MISNGVNAGQNFSILEKARFGAVSSGVRIFRLLLSDLFANLIPQIDVIWRCHALIQFMSSYKNHVRRLLYLVYGIMKDSAMEAGL